jgi:hypothetical protein
LQGERKKTPKNQKRKLKTKKKKIFFIDPTWKKLKKKLERKKE